jgi:hypothetical protein
LAKSNSHRGHRREQFPTICSRQFLLKTTILDGSGPDLTEPQPREKFPFVGRNDLRTSSGGFSQFLVPREVQNAGDESVGVRDQLHDSRRAHPALGGPT